MLCEVEGTIDKNIYRAIAKIGFNYLAYWQGAEFIMNESFDDARKFIRFGSSPDYPLVQVMKKAILADENDKRRRLGHIVTVNWGGNSASIVSQVALFNWITYNIILSKGYSDERKDLKKGNFFNVKSNEIYSLETR